MKKKKFSKNDLIEILIKKASGFYYSEEVYEYVKTQNKSKNNEKQLSFYENNEIFNFSDRDCSNGDSSYDNMKLNERNESTKNLTLAKKKVTTHFIPPDMLAIKALLEIFEEKIDKGFDKMSDKELLELKNKLLGELKNEDN